MPNNGPSTAHKSPLSPLGASPQPNGTTRALKDAPKDACKTTKGSVERLQRPLAVRRALRHAAAPCVTPQSQPAGTVLPPASASCQSFLSASSSFPFSSSSSDPALVSNTSIFCFFCIFTLSIVPPLCFHIFAAQPSKSNAQPLRRPLQRPWFALASSPRHPVACL